MTYEIPGTCRSYEFVGDMSASWYRFVKEAGVLGAAVSAVTDNAIGVLQNKPGRPQSNTTPGPGYGLGLGSENVTGTVMIDGVTRCFTGAAVASGIPCTIDSVGRVVAATAGQKIVGTTKSAATAINQLVSLELKPLGGVVV